MTHWLPEVAAGGVAAATAFGLWLRSRRKPPVDPWPALVTAAVASHREFAAGHPVKFDTALEYQNVLFRAKTLGSKQKLAEPPDLAARVRTALSA